MSSTETSDSGMAKMMGMVMGSLILFALFCMLLARLLGGHVTDESDVLMREALVERIQPVGTVRTTADEPVEAVASADAAPAAEKTGEELVNGACAACHLSGVAGAPKIGADAEWEPRKASGLEALVASVINGKGAMPPRGASAYTDEEITRAVKHLTGL